MYLFLYQGVTGDNKYMNTILRLARLLLFLLYANKDLARYCFQSNYETT